VIAHGASALSASAAGSRNSSLLRRDPLVIFQMIGSSRAGDRPTDVVRRHRGVVDHHPGGLGARPCLPRRRRRRRLTAATLAIAATSSSRATSPPGMGLS
jgi:hypothetical protein